MKIYVVVGCTKSFDSVWLVKAFTAKKPALSFQKKVEKELLKTDHKLYCLTQLEKEEIDYLENKFKCHWDDVPREQVSSLNSIWEARLDQILQKNRYDTKVPKIHYLTTNNTFYFVEEVELD